MTSHSSFPVHFTPHFPNPEAQPYLTPLSIKLLLPLKRKKERQNE